MALSVHLALLVPPIGASTHTSRVPRFQQIPNSSYIKPSLLLAYWSSASTKLRPITPHPCSGTRALTPVLWRDAVDRKDPEAPGNRGAERAARGVSGSGGGRGSLLGLASS